MAKFLSKDGKFYMREGKLLRPTNILEVPIVTTNLTYNGTAQSPTIYGYDSNKMTMGGVTSAVNPGSYTTTFTPKDGYCWADDTTTAKSVVWSINKAIVSVPTQSGGLTYNGGTQYPSWSNYDSNKMTIGGTTSAVNVGTYTTTFTPTANYRWPDWTTTAKNVTWTIGKIAGSLSLSTNSLTIDANSTTGSFTVTRAGDGAISASSNNTGVATVSVSGNTVTVTKVGQGSATITVSVGEGTIHTAPASKTCTVTCKTNTPVGSLAVGSSVYINVDGVKKEFLVVNQGNPDTSIYDSSCDGTWLLMKSVLDEPHVWSSSGVASYENSDIHAYLNGTVLSKFDSGIQNIIKQVKIPYIKGGGGGVIQNGPNGLSTKVFLPSLVELGLGDTAPAISKEGAKLDWFKSSSQYIAVTHPNIDWVAYWIRSANNVKPSLVQLINHRGETTATGPTKDYFYVRPTLILPSDTLVDANMNVIASGA